MCANNKKYLLVVALTILIGSTISIEVQTEEGPILGRTYTTAYENKTFYAFQGIPYAEPPDMFELAVPKAPWTDTLNCTYDKNMCIQGYKKVTGSTDCLFLSVFSPNMTGSASVLFWIHGGGFTSGNNFFNYFKPDLFINKNIVVVLIQYRLGVLGFLSTLDLACPGNLGLKDQVLALDWTRRNIHHFGGNPDDITIAGHSAGGASVGYHVVSPKSQGKFQKAIMESGNSECQWSYSRNARRAAFELGQSLGCITEDSDELIACLKTVDYKDLQIKSLTSTSKSTGLKFGVVTEEPHDTAFLTGQADYLLRTGSFNQVPILIGIVSNEMGMAGNPESSAITQAILAKLDAEPWNLLPTNLDLTPTNRTYAASEIKKHYFNPLLSISSQVPEATEFTNVNLFGRPTHRLVQNVAQYVNCYYYYFSYVGPLGSITHRILPGPQHGEELPYLFIMSNITPTQNDLLISQRMVAMWSNFIITGEPTPGPVSELLPVKWPPASVNDDSLVMKIDLDMENIVHPYNKHYEFYKNNIFVLGPSTPTY